MPSSPSSRFSSLRFVAVRMDVPSRRTRHWKLIVRASLKGIVGEIAFDDDEMVFLRLDTGQERISFLFSEIESFVMTKPKLPRPSLGIRTRSGKKFLFDFSCSEYPEGEILLGRAVDFLRNALQSPKTSAGKDKEEEKEKEEEEKEEEKDDLYERKESVLPNTVSKVHLTKEDQSNLLKRFPWLRKAFLENVPAKMPATEFWTKAANSMMFHQRGYVLPVESQQKQTDKSRDSKKEDVSKYAEKKKRRKLIDVDMFSDITQSETTNPPHGLLPLEHMDVCQETWSCNVTSNIVLHIKNTLDSVDIERRSSKRFEDSIRHDDLEPPRPDSFVELSMEDATGYLGCGQDAGELVEGASSHAMDVNESMNLAGEVEKWKEYRVQADDVGKSGGSGSESLSASVLEEEDGWVETMKNLTMEFRDMRDSEVHDKEVRIRKIGYREFGSKQIDDDSRALLRFERKLDKLIHRMQTQIKSLWALDNLLPSDDIRIRRRVQSILEALKEENMNLSGLKKEIKMDKTIPETQRILLEESINDWHGRILVHSFKHFERM
eukprot:TRINITY_DN66_c2_g1_i3.p1 TRINITY_DN66_c2_g1~~TRINITY_DN66_c2_g1_i3.p1  ORF type:complete len:549 (-),score=146.44 TRINITY_DN66_c2_g1_i3:936-2582(-)